MSNIFVKGFIFAILLFVFIVVFKHIVGFFTLVISDFVLTVVNTIREGLRGSHDIESIVRFCITIIMLLGLARLLIPRQ